MKKLLFIILISVITTITVSCQTKEGDRKFNFDFETVTGSNGLPDGLIKWGMPTYNIKLDPDVKHTGKHSLRIEAED